MPGFLHGKKVLDFTQSVSGPTCTLLLAYLGAEVLKIEGPGGDAARGWGPPFVGELGSMFICFNRGKSSVKIDLTTEAGAAELRRLLAESDVVVQNFRPNAAKRLGVDFDSVTAINKNVVYCAITGFGSTGPRSEEPGYDAMMQAFSGIMHLTGAPDGEPVRTGPGVLDIGAGMLGAIAVLGALVARAEGRPGPWKVETSLAETAAFFVSDRLTSYFITGVEPQRMGSAREGMAPYENFRAKDGFVLIAAGTERFWRKLCDALGLEHLAEDPRFVTNADRVRNRLELRLLIEEQTLKLMSDELVNRLKALAIPTSKVNSLGDFVKDPQIQQLGMFSEAQSEFGVLKSMGMPFTLDGKRRQLVAPPSEPKHVIR